MDTNTINVYDTNAQKYDEVSMWPDRYNIVHEWEKKFVETLPKSGARVCDYGCGTGKSALYFAQCGHICDAFDASEGMLVIARKNCAGENVKLEQMVFNDFKADEDTYDGIWASYSLLHAPKHDVPALLATIHKALKVGGTFYVCLKLDEIDEERDEIGRLYTYFKQEEVEALLCNAGFKVK